MMTISKILIQIIKFVVGFVGATFYLVVAAMLISLLFISDSTNDNWSQSIFLLLFFSVPLFVSTLMLIWSIDKLKQWLYSLVLLSLPVIFLLFALSGITKVVNVLLVCLVAIIIFFIFCVSVRFYYKKSLAR